MRKTKSIVILTILAVLIAFFGVASFASFPILNTTYDYNSIFSQISKGIDLEGGYYAVLTPEVSEEEADKLDLDSVIQTIRTRLDDKGYTEATITKQDVTSLRVEIPNVDNADEVLEILGSQGKAVRGRRGTERHLCHSGASGIRKRTPRKRVRLAGWKGNLYDARVKAADRSGTRADDHTCDSTCCVEGDYRYDRKTGRDQMAERHHYEREESLWNSD